MLPPTTHPNWKLRARIWICVIFLVLCGADYLLLTFSFNRSISDRLQPLMGLAVLGAIFTKVLLIGMWRRMGWARYALGTVLFLSIMGFAVGMFVIFGEGTVVREPGVVKKLVAGMALQALALVPLARSRSIRRQMHPMTGRD